MRKKVPKSKVKETLRIPHDLQDFLADVHFKIVNHDEAAIIECDDCLQCEYAYGGLDKEGGDQFSFTYFPEEGRRTKWEMSLSAADIAKIANYDSDSLEMWGCTSDNCRSKFQNPEWTCFYCDWEEEK